MKYLMAATVFLAVSNQASALTYAQWLSLSNGEKSAFALGFAEALTDLCDRSKDPTCSVASHYRQCLARENNQTMANYVDVYSSRHPDEVQFGMATLTMRSFIELCGKPASN